MSSTPDRNPPTLGLMSWQFRDKANLSALLQVLVDRADTVETAASGCNLLRNVDDAVGLQLDRVGEMVGQVRLGGRSPLGESDDLYRAKVRGRMLVQTSGGTVEDLQGIAKAVLAAKALTVHAVDVPEAAVVLAVQCSSAPSADEAAVLVEFLLAGKAAGVRVLGIAWYVDKTFGFDPDAPVPPIAGYDDGSGTDGGSWAEFIYP